jgi:hypothetical protein
MVEAPQTRKTRRPARFWLSVALCGVASILFAAFMLVVDDICGGQNERSLYFWIFEGFLALLGLLLIIFGLTLLVRAGSAGGSARFWFWVSCCGGLSIMFAVICAVVYTANNGKTGFNLGGIIFGAYESLFIILGIFLMLLGLTRSQKPVNDANEP